MTVLEALREAIDTLNGMCIPVPMIRQLGAPISKTIDLIQASAAALEPGAQHPEDGNEAERQKKEGAEQDDERADV